MQHRHRVHDPGRVADRDVRAPADVRADRDEGGVEAAGQLAADIMPPGAALASLIVIANGLRMVVTALPSQG